MMMGRQPIDRFAPMSHHVDIAFECLPLRSVTRLDIPLDASARYRALRENIKAAMEHHGTERAYFLADAHATFHLVNSEVHGMLRFEAEGTILTDAGDRKVRHTDLTIRLVASTCDWLTAAAEEWFHETVQRALAAEFEEYAASGRLADRMDRIAQRQQAAVEGDLGMFL